MCEGVNWGVIKKTLQNRFLGFLWGRQLRRLAGECFREVRVYNGNRRPATLEQKGVRCLAQGRPCVSIKDQAYCPWCWEVHFDKAIHHVFWGVWVSNILNEVYFNCNFVFYSISQDALSFSDVRSCCSSHHDSCLSLQIQYLWAFTSLLQRGLSVIVMCIFQYFNGKPQVSFSPSNIKRVINNGYKTVCCKKHSWHHLPQNVFSWVLLFWN